MTRAKMGTTKGRGKEGLDIGDVERQSEVYNHAFSLYRGQDGFFDLRSGALSTTLIDSVSYPNGR